MAGKERKSARKVDTSEFAQDSTDKVSGLAAGVLQITKMVKNEDGSLYAEYEIGGQPVKDCFARWGQNYRADKQLPYVKIHGRQERVSKAMLEYAKSIGATRVVEDLEACFEAKKSKLPPVSDW